ncbi:protein Dok-7 isoform X2 [Crotalus tigris]|uniref:protein Dok-7 isoform X2 n=1 Tax=Crotalus tigris TaxID=88082 RepID=UPI00192F3C8E|nr:protein Dok-7 isoform X2 [Crotalus tigris]
MAAGKALPPLAPPPSSCRQPCPKMTEPAAAAAAAVVLEGQLKWREGKKWKSRWLVLRKPSPVADCLLLLVYKERAERLRGLKERSSVTLEDICGLEPGLCYDGLTHTLAIICLTQVVMLGFESKETMHLWDLHVRYSLGEVHRFHVIVAPGTKLESGPATLHFCNDMLVLVKDVPPVIMGQWKLSELRRYGAVPNGFVFEGGTRCGFWAGVFFLSCTEGEKISFLFDCIVHGISPTKGFRRVLPDPSVSPACMEERVAYEASKLEKRLSLLSHGGSHGSGGDDRSLSSASSDTSHSDPSIGSRLTLWPEQSSAGTSQESRGPAAAVATETLQSEGTQGASKPPPSLLRCRQLQEIGRQSSSDSGIATGSHSSYSGSFSSYTGSLDICHGDEFGSLLNLSLSFPSDRNVCSCPGPEYQAPSWLRHTYDTPRSLLATPTAGLLASATEAGPSKGQTLKGDMKQPASHLEREAASRPSQEKDSQGVFPLGSTKGPFPEMQLRQPVQGQDRGGPEAAPCGAVSSHPCELCSSPSEAKPALFPSCPVCGGIQETSILSSQIFTANLELPLSEQWHGDTATYVNIPTSPTAKKQLHYMEVELQEPSAGIRGSETTKYAQIDITATETAHKVGSQHAHFREERLQELEQQQQKKDGPPGSS